MSVRPRHAALLLALPSCDGLPPNAEVVVVVDTDLPPSFADNLRVDVFDEQGQWFESRDIPRPDPADWPASFGIQAPRNDARQLVLRLRAYGTGAVRDYRGERYKKPVAFVPPFVAHDLETLCADPPQLVLGTPLMLRAGREPFLGQLSGGDCAAWGTSIGSVAARVEIAAPGTYELGVIATDPTLGAMPTPVPLQLRRACGDASTTITCDSGVINPNVFEAARITVDLEPGTYYVITAGPVPDTAPVDVVLGAALEESWPPSWDDYVVTHAKEEEPCAAAPLAPVLSNGAAPASEPDPEVAVDRLVRVDLDPDVLQTAHVLLRTSCVGTAARLAAEACAPKRLHIGEAATCIDVGGQLEPVPMASPDPEPRGTSLFDELAAETCAPLPPDAPVACIPGGLFVLGSRIDSGNAGIPGIGTVATMPERPAAIRRFWVDRYEITVADLRAALQAGFDIAPNGYAVVASNNGPLGTTVNGAFLPLCTFSDAPMGREDLPLGCINWYGARALCQFRGGDLPTEAQWEYMSTAAGKHPESIYPWGNTAPDCDRAAIARADNSFFDVCYHATDPATFGPLPVAARPLDVTSQGVVGLCGNVSEHLRDAFELYDHACWAATTIDRRVCEESDATYRAVRGSNWATPVGGGYATLRERMPPGTAAAQLGVRCVYEHGPP